MIRNDIFFEKLNHRSRPGDPTANSELKWAEPGHTQSAFAYNSHAHNAERVAPPTIRQTGDAGEIFYEELKPLWWIFRVMGLFPLQIPARGGATFQWWSKEMFYSLFFFLLMDVVVYFEFVEKISVARRWRHHFNTMMFALLLLMYLLPHLWMHVRHWLSANKLVELFNDWAAFQARFQHLTKHPLRPKLRRRCAVLVIALVIFGYLLVAVECSIFKIIKLWEIFYYGYASVLLGEHLVLWYSLCTLSSKAANKMVTYFKQDMALCGYYNPQLVAKYRLLWLDLSYLTSQFGSVFCYQFGHLLLFWFTSFLLSVYQLSSIVRQPTVLHLGVALNILVNLICILVFCLVAHETTVQVGPTITRQLQVMHTEDEKTRAQLQLFENTIFQNPPLVTLCGYVVVNRQLAVSIITTSVTYLVVMLQFDQTDQTMIHTNTTDHSE